MRLILFVIILFQCSAGATNLDKEFRYYYSIDGEIIELNDAKGTMYYAGELDRYNQCKDSEKNNCAFMLGFKLVVPTTTELPENWQFAGVNYCVAEKLNFPKGRYYLITFSVGMPCSKQQMVLPKSHFIYLEDRGIIYAKSYEAHPEGAELILLSTKGIGFVNK